MLWCATKTLASSRARKMRRLALLSLVPAALALTAPALRPRARGRFLRSSPDDDEAPPEISEDFRDFRARLIARTKGEGLTEAGDERAVAEGWAYETPLLEAGCLLLGGTEQDFGFGLRQQYFHKCVLLLTQHDEFFTRGVIVNRPSRRTVRGWTVWCGGDVEEGGVFAPHGGSSSDRPPALECLSTVYIEGAASCTEVNKDLYTTSFEDANKALDRGYEKSDFMCLCGYAGWAPKQLDGEVERSSWHVASVDGGTLVKDLLAREDDEALPVDDGLGTWAQLMRRLGKDPAPSGFEFDDEMLRAWIAARLDAPKVDVTALADAARRKQREETYLESILDDNGEVTPGVVFTCQALAPAADFLLERQFLHKSVVQVIAVQQDTVIMCCLNRPTSRRVALKLGDAERVKTVAFGGDVQVRSAQGGVVWLSRGPLPGGAGERLPAGGLEEEDATHVVAARDVVEGLKRADVRVEAVLAASGVVAFPVAELRRLLGAGHVVPVPPDAAPLDQCWALHAPGAAADPEDAWRRAYAAAVDAARGAPPAATPAELRGGIADEALDRFVGTFLS